MQEKEKQYTIDVIAAMTERTIKRLWILIILLVVLLFGSNAAWLWYESQWEKVTTEVTQEVDTKNGSAYVSGIGDVYYGESPADSTNENQTP